MNRERFDRIEELFHKAKVLAAEDRATFLDEACVEDLELRAEVESLLTHSERTTSLVDIRAANAETNSTIVERGPLAEGPGTRIGAYKILQQIGEGGFGVVYMAEQEEPVQRKVALKIIKLGMDTKQVIARFEAERQALAMMDHPNIASVLDGGATETGRPYFVMELVKGIPITEYCDKGKLTTRQRLELFKEVCQAIQHAHQKGIIHRDIKPSNVLVTLHDTRAVPKVIDFGIAKATSRRLTEKTLFTEFRHFIGTPEYMSPDQAEMSGLDVDTRTDIYSLGVLLYELLTGTTPFDSKTLRQAAYGEIQRIIREVEPPKPSTRVDTLVRDGTEIATKGQVEPTALRRLFKGDLDWIVMKAMDKDRTRRYQSASELSADIDRYTSNQPILAGPPSVLYKFRKFVLRHRLSVAAGSLVAAAILIGVTLAMIGFIEARDEARHSLDVSEFLQQMTMVERDIGRTENVSLDQIVQRGKELFGDDHAMVGHLLMTRASTLNTAGRLNEAILAQREALAHYRSAHQGDHPAVAAALTALAGWLKDDREYVEAEQFAREGLEMKRRLYGDKDTLTADALTILTELLVETGADRTDELKPLWGDAVLAYEASLGRNHRTTVLQRAYYARWLHDNGYYDEALPLLEESVIEIRRVLGDGELALLLVQQSQAHYHLLVIPDQRAAAAIVEEMVHTAREIWGSLNPTVALITMEAAILWSRADDNDAAGRLISDYLAARSESSWEPGLTTLYVQGNLVDADSLEPWFDEHPDVGHDLVMLTISDIYNASDLREDRMSDVLGDSATWLAAHGFDSEAEPIFAELLSLLRQAPEPDAQDMAYVLVMLGASKLHLGEPAAAEPLLREGLAIREQTLPASSWLIGRTKSALGQSLCDQGLFAESEPLIVGGYEAMAGGLEAPALRRREAMDRIIALYEKWGKPEQAEQWRKRSQQLTLPIRTPV